MIRGYIELGIDKVVMFGIAGSGKTCTVALLLGMKAPEIRCSTPLMKRPIELMFINIDENQEWRMRTPKEIQDIIAEIIRSRMKQAEAQSSASPASPGQQPSHTTASQSLQPTPEKTSSTTTSEAAGKSTTSSEKKPAGREQPEAEGSLDSLLLSIDVEEEFVSLINSSPPSSVPIVRVRQILVLDSGGQPQFHEMMPVFVNGASKFVYVFKVHESLDKRTMVRYFDGRGKLVYEFPASQTNEDTLKQCTRTMSSLTAKNTDIPLPRMLFLATHRDMVADESLPGVLDSLHKRLKEILLPQFKEQLIFCDKKGEDFIFTLNAEKPVKEDKECAEAIRRCLSEEEGMVVKVPLRWYALYQKLLQVVEGLGKKVLSREQCRSVAESMDIDDESCEEALNFFNGLNMLFYFPDILEHLVFMEPQILLDNVTELVEESYRMRQDKKNQPLCPMTGDRLKFRDYGQVTEKFLSKFSSHYEEPLFTPKELITLLKGLLVFADLSEDVYFMPCLLQVVTSEVVAQYRFSGEKALALHFPNSGPLLGMFCSTVAYLLSPENAHPCPWKVVQNEAGTPECLNRNVIEFTVSEYAGTVSLIDHFTHFEIHVHTHPKKAAQLWKLAHDAVFAGLKKAGKTLGYTNNTPVPAIVCPAHPATPHPATVDVDFVWKCSKMSRRFGDVAEGTIPWLTVRNTHGEHTYTQGLCRCACLACIVQEECAKVLKFLIHLCPPSLTAAVPCVSTQSPPSSTDPQPHPPTLPGESCSLGTHTCNISFTLCYIATCNSCTQLHLRS